MGAGDVSDVLWMVVMFESAHVDLLEREMARASGGPTSELKARIVSHGSVTQQAKPSLRLRDGSEISR